MPPSSSTSAYQNLVPQQSQPTSSGRHRSWSSADSDAYSTWSSPQSYSLPTAATGPELDHAIIPMPQYAFTQPPVLGSNAPTTSAPWDWNTPSISAPLHAESAVPNLTLSNPPYYGYNEYSVLDQVPLHHNAPYAPFPMERNYSALREMSPASMHGSDTTEQHNYGSHASGSDPRFEHPYNPGYQF